ncbi:MAG: DUF1289 domain-containing protein [Lutimaribacter sp.]
MWARDEVASPCVKICVVHPQERICVGCFRTIDEIARWSRMGQDERQDVVNVLPGRQSGLQKRRGGRAARRGA